MDDKAFISDIEYLSLQASIICLLLLILSTTTIIEYPGTVSIGRSAVNRRA
jgi:hypothetical protein